jgi:hypothetical protein
LRLLLRRRRVQPLLLALLLLLLLRLLRLFALLLLLLPQQQPRHHQQQQQHQHQRSHGCCRRAPRQTLPLHLLRRQRQSPAGRQAPPRRQLLRCQLPRLWLRLALQLLLPLTGPQRRRSAA